MKRMLVLLCAGLCMQLSAYSQGVLYTNAADGATVSLGGGVSVVNNLISNEVVAITFDSTSGSGAISGPGGLSVSSTEPATHRLAGIIGVNITNQNMGNISVVNNHSGYTGPNSTNGTGAAGIIGDVIGDTSSSFSITANGANGTNPNGNTDVRAEAIGIDGLVVGNMSGNLTISATGGSASSTNYSVNTSAEAKGISGHIRGHFSGTASVTAQGGTATGLTNAYSDARSLGIFAATNVTGNITSRATGGTATATEGIAGAVAFASGLETAYGDVSSTISSTASGGTANSQNGDAHTVAFADGSTHGIAGSFGGTINSTATGGTATGNNAFSFAAANGAMSMGPGIGGNLTGTINSTATGGRSVADGGIADSSAHAFGNSGVTGNMAGTINVTARGGPSAYSTNGSAIANAISYGISGPAGVGGDLSGNITATAVGTSATAINGNAHAIADAQGSGSVNGHLSGIVSATATGGTAHGDYAFADAVAYGVNGNISSNMSGRVTATATGGQATSDNNNASAPAMAYGVYGGIGGNVTGLITATAMGGSSYSTNSNANSHTDAYAVNNDIEGHVNAAITANATSGNAQGGDSAEAGANAYAVSGSTSNINAAVRSTATAGSAVANNHSAYASAYTEGISDTVYGDVNAAITATTIAGSTYSTNSSAYSHANSYAVSSDIEGDVGGVITANATSGNAQGGDSAEAGANAYAVSGSTSNINAAVRSTATAGSAVANNHSAYASAYTEGISGTVYGDVNAAITATAQGNTAYSTNSSAYSGADAYAVNSDIEGDIKAAITANAIGGSAQGDYASANANAYGVNGSVSNVNSIVQSTATARSAVSDSSSANAYAYTEGINSTVYGDVNAAITATAMGGPSYSTNTSANSHTDAYAVNSDIEGNVNAAITANATGSNAQGNSAITFAWAHGVSGGIGSNVNAAVRSTATAGSAVADSGTAQAYAYTEGISGTVYGDVNAAITATAMGGSSYSTNSNAQSHTDVYAVNNGIDGNVNAAITANATSGDAQGGSSAITFAWAHGVNGGIGSNVNARITANATAGSAVADNGASDAGSSAYAVSGGVGGTINADIIANAWANTAISTNNIAIAFANAHGLTGGDVTGEVKGDILATAVGGIADGSGVADATARAYGIEGPTVIISNLTGRIIASATAGLEIVGGVTNVANAYAYAIDASTLNLSASNAMIHALVQAPTGYDLSPGSMAYSIISGSGDDVVELHDTSLIGTVDLQGGNNTLAFFGDNYLRGSILGSGVNTVSLDGFLKLGAPTVITNLPGGGLNVADGSGFGFELASTNTLSAAMNIDGDLNPAGDVTIGAFIVPGQSAAGILGNDFDVILASGGITTNLSQDVRSLFNIEITNSATVVTITPTSIKRQNGSSTPSGPGSIQNCIGSANAFMGDLSKQAALSRSGNSTSGQSQPAGAAGPALQQGQWQSFVRQFNSLGTQDSEAGNAGYDWMTHGLMFGAEKMVGDKLAIGTAMGGAWSNLEGDMGAGEADSQMFMLGLFGSYQMDTCYAEAGLSLAFSGNDTERIDSTSTRYTGDFDSTLIGAWLESGCSVADVEPYGRLTFISGQHDGYTDSGSGGLGSVTFEDETTENLPLEIGVRGEFDWTAEDNTGLNIKAKAGLRHELLDTEVSVNGTLSGLPLRFNSAEADATAIVLGVEGDWQVNDNIGLSLEYEPAFSGNWMSHYISGTFKYTF